jgi:hypothetical protein
MQYKPQSTSYRYVNYGLLTQSHVSIENLLIVDNYGKLRRGTCGCVVGHTDSSLKALELST